MSDEIKVGSRVKHPSKSEWGIGQVLSVNLPKVTVFFEVADEKTINTELVGLIPVYGVEGESQVLDSKFRKKRTVRRAFEGSIYFNDGKGASRKQFIERFGATCANWSWSWSFVNHDDKKIYFGAWQELFKDNRALIFSDDWKTRRGRESNGWPESRENIRLVEEEGYSLHVYTMIPSPDSQADVGNAPRKIGAILNDVSEATLFRDGSEWYALFPES